VNLRLLGGTATALIAGAAKLPPTCFMVLVFALVPLLYLAVVLDHRVVMAYIRTSASAPRVGMKARGRGRHSLRHRSSDR
jgi:hypothetical protein